MSAFTSLLPLLLVLLRTPRYSGLFLPFWPDSSSASRNSSLKQGSLNRHFRHFCSGILKCLKAGCGPREIHLGRVVLSGQGRALPVSGRLPGPRTSPSSPSAAFFRARGKDQALERAGAQNGGVPVVYQQCSTLSTVVYGRVVQGGTG